jgi:hypothetical protein
MGRKEVFGIHLLDNIALAIVTEDYTISKAFWSKLKKAPIYIQEGEVVDYADRWSTSVLDFMKGKLSQEESAIVGLRSKILTMQGNYGRLKIMDDLIQLHGKKFISDSIERVIRLKEVEKVKLYATRIIVTTIPLCSDPIISKLKTYPSKYVGQWEISVSSNLQSIRIRNIASATKDRQSCHSNQSHGCMGGFYDAIGKCLQDFNLEGVIANSIEYLRNFSPDDLSGRDNFESLPNSTKQPEKPHVFENWISLITPKRGD